MQHFFIPSRGWRVSISHQYSDILWYVNMVGQNITILQNYAKGRNSTFCIQKTAQCFILVAKGLKDRLNFDEESKYFFQVFPSLYFSKFKFFLCFPFFTSHGLSCSAGMPKFTNAVYLLVLSGEAGYIQFRIHLWQPRKMLSIFLDGTAHGQKGNQQVYLKAQRLHYTLSSSTWT